MPNQNTFNMLMAGQRSVFYPCGTVAFLWRDSHFSEVGLKHFRAHGDFNEEGHLLMSFLDGYLAFLTGNTIS